MMKARKGKRSNHLVDEEDEEDQPAFEPQVEDDEYNLQRGIQMSLESFQAPVGGVRRIPVTQDTSTGPFTQPHDDTSANVVRDTSSPADAETGADMERTVELNEGQAGSDPGKTPESRPPLEEDHAGSNPG
ncbi:hypothetical protein Tco_1515067 [Tanacetum coccineum]